MSTCRHPTRSLAASAPGPSELDPDLGLDAAAERVLDKGHFGYQIGRLDELGPGIAAGHDDVQVTRLGLQCRDDFVERQVVVAQHDVELVEQHQPVGAIGDHRLGRLPRLARGGDVAGPILGVPGEALAHRPASHELTEPLERDALAGGPHALDELDDADPHAVAETTQHYPKCGGRLAFSLTGMDDQQPTLLGLGGQHALACRLAPRHLLVVTTVDLLLCVGEITHGAFHLARASPALLLRGRHNPRSIASAKRWRVSASAAGLCSAMKSRTASSAR